MRRQIRLQTSTSFAKKASWRPLHVGIVISILALLLMIVIFGINVRNQITSHHDHEYANVGYNINTQNQQSPPQSKYIGITSNDIKNGRQLKFKSKDDESLLPTDTPLHDTSDTSDTSSKNDDNVHIDDNVNNMNNMNSNVHICNDDNKWKNGYYNNYRSSTFWFATPSELDNISINSSNPIKSKLIIIENCNSVEDMLNQFKQLPHGARMMIRAIGTSKTTLTDETISVSKSTSISQAKMNIKCMQRLLELTQERHYAAWTNGAKREYFVDNIFCWKCGCVAEKKSTKKLTTNHNKQTRFYQIASNETKTDKIRKHDYHRLYNKYLDYYYNKSDPHSLLEIGLGCGMDYGPGESAILWKKLFLNMNINFIEYNKNCVDKYQDTINKSGYKVFVGDQAEPKFLEQVKDEIRILDEELDIIIDDGGHWNKQIIISFGILWPFLSRNGLYFIEDFGESSYVYKYVDSQPVQGFGQELAGTAQYFIKNLLENLFCHVEIAINQRSCYDLELIECIDNICVLKKTNEIY